MKKSISNTLTVLTFLVKYIQWGGARIAYVKGGNRQQIAMFPEVMDDYVAEDNSVIVIEAFVMNLDIFSLKKMVGLWKENKIYNIN